MLYFTFKYIFYIHILQTFTLRVFAIFLKKKKIINK
jgi:hypothetical protein